MLFDRFRHRRFFLGAVLSLAPLLMLACAGCDALGVAASKVVGDPEVAPSYTGLKGQRVAIMVWADEGLTVDHPRISADVANSLQGKLKQGLDAKVDELKGTTFVDPATVLRFQEAHPESQADSAEQIALRLGADRLIYIEVESVSLHPTNAVDLSRGEAVTDVKVVEVRGAKAKVAYENAGITGVYPPDAPPEGLPNLAEDQVYHKTIDALTTELGKLFITHPAEEHDQ